MEPARATLEAMGPGASDPGSRGFAWSYLGRLTRQTVAMLPALQQRVRAVATSPDGRTIALADDCAAGLSHGPRVGPAAGAAGPASVAKGIPFSSSPPTAARWPRCARPSPARKGPSANVALWDVATGEAIAGMPPHLELVYGLGSARTGGAWSRSRPVAAAIPPRSAGGRSPTIGDACRAARVACADQLAARLTRRRGDRRSPGRFSSPTRVTVSPDREPAAAVWRDRRRDEALSRTGAATCSPSAWSSGTRSSPSSAQTTSYRTRPPTWSGSAATPAR